MSAGPQPSFASTELGKRVLSALVMAPLAVFAAWFGGWAWLAAMTAVALLLAWEWNDLTRDGRLDMAACLPLALVLVVALALGLGFAGVAVLLFVALAAGAVVLLLLPHTGITAGEWSLGGAVYALALLVPAVVLRGGGLGFEAILFLYALVWTTDVAAYFVGRTVGGPKLWPALSPKKTWSGFAGGLSGGALAAFLIALVLHLPNPLALALLALVLSLVAQGGDLFESWVKRSFRKKDSGALIPGHGGAMDRLDGFIAAAVLALLIGLLRSGFADPAAGLLRW